MPRESEFVGVGSSHAHRHRADRAQGEVLRATGGAQFQPGDIADILYRRLDGKDAVLRQAHGQQQADVVGGIILLRDHAVPRELPVGEGTLAGMVEGSRQHGYLGDRHLVRGVPRCDVANVGDTGLRQLQHVGRLAELLRRVVVECDGVVGALLDLFHPGLEDELHEVVALRKGVCDPQMNWLGGMSQNCRCNQKAGTGKRPQNRDHIFSPGDMLLFWVAAHKRN